MARNPLYDNIPDELKALNQWVFWRLEKTRDGKPTKVPYDPRGGHRASTTNPSDWGSFADAVRTSVNGNGIGFVFTAEAGYVGLDIDHSNEPELVNWFGSYAEKSQSGNGVHVIMKGVLPEYMGKEGHGRRSGKFELYDRGRYFCVTGNIIHPQPIAACQDKINEFIASVFTPPPLAQPVDLSNMLPRPNDNNNLINEIEQSAQGPLFREYAAGGLGLKASHSEADAGFLSILRWWTGGDQTKSFNIFMQSARAQGERAEKINRPDYLTRTWNALTGPVRDEITALPNIIVKAKEAAPWRKSSITHVEEAIAGTILEPIVNALRTPSLNLLPTEPCLAKALALCGCALSGKRPAQENKSDLSTFLPKHGHHLAKLRILTGNGAVANFWVLTVGASSSGKDIGGLGSDVCAHFNWRIGTSGSEEGIADAYVKNNNGLLEISEMRNWLDQRHWQHKASGFLTEAFNKGFFSHALSRRGECVERSADYCYPNICASVQPGILQEFASTSDVDSGFLGRFLIIQIPDHDIFPCTRNLSPELNTIIGHLKRLQALAGEITMPDYYSRPLITMFRTENAEPQATWKRLANEYSVRFAIPLSLPAQPANDQPAITPDGWARAQVLVQYFFKQAEEVFQTLHFNPTQSRFENLVDRIYRCIQRAPDHKRWKYEIGYLIGKGNKAKDRDEAIRELIERGSIISTTDKGPQGGSILSLPKIHA
jgi:hypothetical protein